MIINRPKSRTILILCLCLVSLVILPFIPAGLPGIDVEDYDPFDHAEPEFDIFVFSIIGLAIAASVYSKPRAMKLDFESTSLSPVSPPPKSS
jgi:hypothetical protein